MSSIDSAGRFNPSNNSGAQSQASRLHQSSPGSTAHYRAAIRRQPDIRPEVLARARALALDPDYPSIAVIKRIACQILAAPDLSEEEF